MKKPILYIKGNFYYHKDKAFQVCMCLHTTCESSNEYFKAVIVKDVATENIGNTTDRVCGLWLPVTTDITLTNKVNLNL